MDTKAIPILDINNLKMHYINKYQTVRAIEDVSFYIGEGETFGLVGESGCGKSATCRAIAGLLPDNGRILSGSIKYRERELIGLKEREMITVRGSGIGMVFQEPMTALNPVLTIETQLVETMRGQGLGKRQKRDRAIELLQLVDISEPESRLKQHIHQFSGGMRQRVMIAIALAAKPEVLLADEPTTALDVTIQQQIITLLNRLKKELGMSIVLVTHDLGVVRMMCDRVAVMYAGYIVETATTDTLLKNPRHPYTLGLINSLPREHDRREKLEPIPGAPPDQTEQIKGCPFAPRCFKAGEICFAELPAMQQSEPGHFLRCHYSV